MVKINCIGRWVITLLMSVVCSSVATASTIKSPLTSQTESDDAQTELLASLGIGSGTDVQSQTLQVSLPPGLEAYAGYFPLTIFSGYLNTWLTSSSPQQVLLSNLLSSNGLSWPSTENSEKTDAILEQVFKGSSNDDSHYSASLTPTSSGTPTTTSVILQSTSTLMAPEPGTLMLFGCATVALSLALANRSSKDLSGDLSNLPDVTDTTRLPTE